MTATSRAATADDEVGLKAGFIARWNSERSGGRSIALFQARLRRLHLPLFAAAACLRTSVRLGLQGIGLAIVVYPTAAAADTALVAATQRGDLAALEATLQAGAVVDQPDADGWTALMFASSRARDAIASRLLQAGADVNRTDRTGATALMVLTTAYQRALDRHARSDEVAAYSRTAEALLEGGANVDLVDGSGLTALLRMKELPRSEAESTIERRIRSKGAISEYELSDLKLHLERLGIGSGLSQEPRIGPKTREAVARLEARTGGGGKGLPNRESLERVRRLEHGLRDEILARVRRARGVLDGAHGVYNGYKCGRAEDEELPLNRVMHRTSEWILWSEGQLVYFSRGRGYRTLVSRVVEDAPGGWTLRWKEGTVDRAAYGEALRRELDAGRGSQALSAEPYTTWREHEVPVRKLRLIEQVDGRTEEFELFVGSDIFRIGEHNRVYRRCALE